MSIAESPYFGLHYWVSFHGRHIKKKKSICGLSAWVTGVDVLVKAQTPKNEELEDRLEVN